MRIFSQLALAGSGMLALATIAIALLLSDLYSDSYRDFVEQHSRGLHQVLAESLANRVVQGDALELRDVLEQVRNSEAGLAYLYVTDFDGKLFAHTFENGFPRALLPTLQLRADKVEEGVYRSDQGGINHYSAPLIKGMHARIFIGSDDSHQRATLIRLRDRVMVIAVFVIATGLLTWLLLARRITTPLSRLTDFVGRYGQGAVSVAEELPREGAIEVGRLADAIADMVRQRKHMQNDLLESERRLRTLMDNLPGMAYRCENTPDWPMSFVSNGSRQLTGYRPGELVAGDKLAFSTLIEPADRARVWDEIQLAVSQNRQFGLEYRIHRKDGSERWVWEQGLCVRSDDNKPIFLEGYITDITEQKRAEQALRELNASLEIRVEQRTVELAAANERLQELDRLKSLFIASMSHELRTPLNSIIGFTGLMQMEIDGPVNEKQRDYLRRVNGSGKHLLNLITDIIDVSKIEAGKIVAYVETVLLDDVIEDAMRSISVQAEDKNLKLEFAGVRGTRIETDRGRLLQCLLNFLSNAVKYTETGEIRIAVNQESENVRLSVNDTGTGIAEQHMPLLFQQFSRLPSNTTIPGTGLGLYLTRKLASEVLEAQVGVESVEGKGSTFWLELPREISGDNSAGH
ncbi:MAG: PAS domain-containing protein [Candidatus Thiodiazotropha sp. (ex. Lucinisca nassula)]|nr:PAS domain-containing protein [Candidatus Thiodiazotropha sp. (ex. Lucinisca nassula)]